MSKRLQKKKAAMNTRTEVVATYKDYKNRFRKAVKNLKNQGYDTTETPLSQTEWEARYKAHYNTRRREIEKGKREEMGNINSKLVEEQLYVFSGKQAEGIRSYLLENAPDVKISKTALKLDVMDFYGNESVIAAEASQLRQQGLRGKEISLYIGQRFFGST